MDITQIDLTDNNFLDQYVNGGGLSSFMRDTMKLIGDMGEGSGLDLSPLSNMMESMDTILPDKRITLGELISLNNEDDIIQSFNKLSLDVKHDVVLEELVTAGYIRAANCYCTTYGYNPPAEIAELAQEQVLPLYLEYIDHPRLTHGLNLMGSMLFNFKGMLGELGANTDILNIDVFNNIIEGKEIKREDISVFLDLDPNKLKEEFSSKDEDSTRALLTEFIKIGKVDIVKVILEAGYPVDKALDIAYEYGQDEIADYILTLLPEAELVDQVSLDALALDEE